MSAAVLLSHEERLQLKRERLNTGPAYDFAPHDGVCWSCHADLIEHYRDRWPTVIVTGCPKCCRSYCE